MGLAKKLKRRVPERTLPPFLRQARRPFLALLVLVILVQGVIFGTPTGFWHAPTSNWENSRK